jgi:hypothetical protein
MPNIDLSILNQRQTPAFYADTLANRPAAGFVGRIFVSTNTFAFYRDNGTGWDLIGGPGTGTITGSGAAGQVSYWNGASTITGSNDLFFDAVNGHLGVGTITPGTALDVKHDQSTVVQLEQITATNDNRIAFITSGVGLWRLGAFYNAGANDFGLFDIVGSIQPITVKKITGQVLIGTSTVGSGKLVVASATGDNGVQIVGATAPSLRIDSAESGPTKRIGLGLATAVNNFIQNSQNLDMCIFNGSTSAAGNMLFGIYDTALANVQEAARISAARNFLIGTITDTGAKLQVVGDAYISGNTGIGTNTPGFKLHVLASTGLIGTFATSDASGGYVGFRYSSTINYGYIGTGNFLLTGGAVSDFAITTGGAGNILFGTGAGDERARITSSGNFLIGTTTDNGAKLQVAGTITSTGDITITKSSAASFIANNTSTNGKSFRIVSKDDGNLTIQNTGVADLITISTGGNLLIGTTTNGASKLRIVGLPTSAVGLSSGDIYSNAGILTIVP